MSLRDKSSYVLHRYLRVPYALNVVEFQSPKKPRATFVLLHGVGNSAHAWDDVIKEMPRDVRIIGIDLLGFGESPKPRWLQYNAKTQARSVAVTILGLKLTQQPILVGHSMGSLVAVEVAKRYPFAVKRLVLCSPPFYRPLHSNDIKQQQWQDKTLRSLYKIAVKHPEELQKMAPVAVKLGIANKVMKINEDTASSYVASLEAAIINQTSLEDVATLRLPIDIFYGCFDPVVVKKYIVELEKRHSNIATRQVFAAHEITGKYVTALAKHLATLRSE